MDIGAMLLVSRPYLTPENPRSLKSSHTTITQTLDKQYRRYGGADLSDRKDLLGSIFSDDDQIKWSDLPVGTMPRPLLM